MIGLVSMLAVWFLVKLIQAITNTPNQKTNGFLDRRAIKRGFKL